MSNNRCQLSARNTLNQVPDGKVVVSFRKCVPASHCGGDPISVINRISYGSVIPFAEEDEIAVRFPAMPGCPSSLNNNQDVWLVFNEHPAVLTFKSCGHTLESLLTDGNGTITSKPSGIFGFEPHVAGVPRFVGPSKSCISVTLDNTIGFHASNISSHPHNGLIMGIPMTTGENNTELSNISYTALVSGVLAAYMQEFVCPTTPEAATPQSEWLGQLLDNPPRQCCETQAHGCPGNGKKGCGCKKY